MKGLRVLAPVLLMVILMAADLYAAVAGRLTHVEGQVTATGTDGKPRSIQLGSEVLVGEVVATQPKSRAEITFDDYNRLRLAENTSLTIAEYMATPDQSRMRVDLQRGLIESRVRLAIGRIFGPKAVNRFEVHTPTAAVGVRGTRFFTAHIEGVTRAVFAEGYGYGFARNLPDQVKDVAAGQALTVTSADTAPAVEAATDAQIRQLTKETAPAGMERSQEIESQIQDTGARIISHPAHNWFTATGNFSLTDQRGGRGHYFDLTTRQESQGNQLKDLKEQEAEAEKENQGGKGGSGGGGC